MNRVIDLLRVQRCSGIVATLFKALASGLSRVRLRHDIRPTNVGAVSAVIPIAHHSRRRLGYMRALTTCLRARQDE